MINHENNPNYLNSFLDYTITILNKSPNTVKEYNYDLTTFLKFIKLHFKLTNEEDFSNITIKDISIDTIKKIKLDDIHAFLAYLTNTYHSKATTRARKVSSSLEDSKKVLAVTGNEKNRNNKRDYAIITLFLNCGMRLSELVGINIKDINFSERQMTVFGKGNKERTVYLNDACISAINNYLAIRPVDGIKTDKANSKNALFLSERRERISRRTVQYIVDKELSIAGLDNSKYSVHKLRHTAATLMYRYGHVDIRALQEILGHESISTTEIYTHVANVQARSAIESNPLANIKQD